MSDSSSTFQGKKEREMQHPNHGWVTQTNKKVTQKNLENTDITRTKSLP